MRPQPAMRPASGKPAGMPMMETKRAVRTLARKGRRGDTTLGHLTPKEIVVPERVQQQPGVMEALVPGFGAAGLDIERYRGGGEGDSENPETGAPQFADAGEADPDHDSDVGGTGTGAAPGGSQRDPAQDTGISGGRTGGVSGWGDPTAPES